VILSTISKHNQGINPLNISLVLGLKPSFITNSLKKFEKMRLIFLAENVIKDKRFKSYTISPKGLGILNESQVAVEEGLIELFEGVSPKDLEGFNTVLKHLSLRGEKTIASS
jgi:DNA-binding MarR family transcriptional regulator